MNPKIKSLFTNVRVIVLIVSLIFAVIAIHPDPSVEGVTVRNVARNSSAYLAGFESPKPTDTPMSKERILAIGSKRISNTGDYFEEISRLRVNQTLTVRTTKGVYRVLTQADIEVVELNETVNKTIISTIQVNETVNGTLTTVERNLSRTVEVPKTEEISRGVKDMGLSVYDAPKTNIRKGLDLQGGTRVLLQPEEKLSKDSTETLIDNMEQRLNVYGLSDIIVRSAGDLSGDQFIVVEIPGASEAEVKELLSKQGKFEAKIGNTTVFKGGEDVTYVCRSADCSGIDPSSGCRQVENGYSCRFRFAISLSPEAARRQSEATGYLDVLTTDENGNPVPRGQQYLSEKLDLYLDDVLVDSLSIGADLRGRAVTDIQISGGGVGLAQQNAVFDALNNMKKLQTILVTGSLPVKLSIVKTDNISPSLGVEFAKNALLIGLLAIVAVAVVVSLRYRKIAITVPLVLTSLSEVILLLGMAALIGWKLDLAAIAGIIIAVGTGVDHQIIITDETLKRQLEYVANWKQKIKKAFSIIMGAYFTTMVAMVPLLFAGAGLLKGFALTTMMGVSFGVFITRPAYAAIIEILLKE